MRYLHSQELNDDLEMGALRLVREEAKLEWDVQGGKFFKNPFSQSVF